MLCLHLFVKFDSLDEGTRVTDNIRTKKDGQSDNWRQLHSEHIHVKFNQKKVPPVALRVLAAME